jgi:hypothetical protein
MGFLIAFCAGTAVCYLLFARADRIRAERRFARGASGGARSDTGPSTSSDSWTLVNWPSSDTSSGSSDGSGGQSDFGSCGGSSDGGGSDSGGGDCGGGGGTD